MGARSHEVGRAQAVRYSRKRGLSQVDGAVSRERGVRSRLSDFSPSPPQHADTEEAEPSPLKQKVVSSEFRPSVFSRGRVVRGRPSDSRGQVGRGRLSDFSLSPPQRSDTDIIQSRPTQVRGGGGLPSPFGGKDFVHDSMD